VNFLDPVQFFRFLKGRCHGNQFCVPPDLFAQSRSISGSAGPIFAVFLPNESVLGGGVQMIDLDLFLRYLKGCCHDFVKKMAYSPLSSLWHSEMEWDNAVYMHD